MFTQDVCVLIPHYNNIEGLLKTLKSIDEEEKVNVVVVDDGSREKLNEEMLNVNPNLEIHLLWNKKNRGIEYVLNDGLKYALDKGFKYVARLDCGDENVKNRLKKQYEFLEKNRDVFLVGSWADFVNKNKEVVFSFKPPADDSTLKKHMFINNMFIHPSVMFRLDAVKKIGMYPVDVKNAEDYAYFFKFVKSYKVANIPEVLVRCELDPKGLSLSKRKLQLKSRLKVILQNFDFSAYSFYGLFRNLIVYIIPYALIEKLKRRRG